MSASAAIAGAGPEYARRLQAECRAELLAEPADFGTQFMAVHHLQQLVREQPDRIEPESVRAIHLVLAGGRFARQRQGLFFYRQAAETLRDVIFLSPRAALARQALDALKLVLGAVSGHGHRAAAEALGGLPVDIRGPAVEAPRRNGVPSVSWEQVLRAAGAVGGREPVRYGRSLAVPAGDGGLLVVKLARADQPPEDLLREVMWLCHLREEAVRVDRQLSVPRPIAVNGRHLFRLTPAPAGPEAGILAAGGGLAIGFVAGGDYFRYPNMSHGGPPLGFETFAEVMERSARLLGRLAAAGIIHDAPIPLFHNRVQVHRRRDHGRYEWFRAGRLDRWLESCAYPNFGLGGLRDFEHLSAFSGDSLKLYRHIGAHFLSLFLVAGSYFRHRQPGLAGRAADGSPVDARHLFDHRRLREVTRRIFTGYHAGFAGAYLSPDDVPLDWDALTARMIEEMGVDRHMEEILRAADQKEMSTEAFERFLAARGFAEGRIRQIPKGAEDLVIPTGPHLGGFNQRISLPELIEAIETMSALCVAGRFFGSSEEGVG